MGGRDLHDPGNRKEDALAHSRKFKIVTGSVTVALALGAGTALANGGTDDDVDLEDVVPISEVKGPADQPLDVTLVAELLDEQDSTASPFDTPEETVDESLDESIDTPDDSPESLDDSPESPDDSPDSPDDSPESPDDSPDSPDSNDTT